MSGRGIFGLVVSLSVVFWSCSPRLGGEGKYEDTVPGEIEKVIGEKCQEGLYAVGTAVAGDEMVAVNRASMQARAEIARQFEAQVNVLQKDYQESVSERTTGEYSQVMEVFATLELNGSQIIKSMVRKESDGQYSAKVLVAVTAQRMKEVVDERLRAFTSFRASKAYKELEERVERERERETRSEEEEIF
ncbi:MAG: hypothetical protein ACLFVQ_08340 [Chitinispirillaceae bacterium]